MKYYAAIDTYMTYIVTPRKMLDIILEETF